MSAERVQCADAASRPNEPQLENTQIIIDARGELVATYVKTHLADIYVPLVRFRLAESKLFRHGSRLVPPVQTPIGKLGLLTVRSPSHSLALSFSRVHCSLFTRVSEISSAVLDRTRVRVQCYDLRFPELGLWQYGQGAEVISYPAAFVHEPASERWSVCRADYHFSYISTFTAVQNNWFARTRYSKLFPVFVMFFSRSAL